MSHTLTIAGRQFSIEPRYAEGHTLNANEASALNQTFYENLRNNFANAAKEGKGQEDFDAYAAQYQFGVRSGGTGGSRDPVEVEAMKIARDVIKEAIKSRGQKVSEVSAESISAAAAKLLDKDPKYRELARQRVEEARNNAASSIDDDLLAGLEPAKPGEPEDASAAGEGEVPAEESAAPTSRKRNAGGTAE